MDKKKTKSFYRTHWTHYITAGDCKITWKTLEFCKKTKLRISENCLACKGLKVF